MLRRATFSRVDRSNVLLSKYFKEEINTRTKARLFKIQIINNKQRNMSVEATPFGSRPPYKINNEGGDNSNPPCTNSSEQYSASCHCGRVTYVVEGEPEDAKLCHCKGCQELHGAPFEWVAIFHKHRVSFPDRISLNHLYFYSSEHDRGWDAQQANERILPTKVSCSHCRTPIADEGRNMWLAFATLFNFQNISKIPKKFKHTCHLFYGQRCIDIPDDKPKWTAHKNHSKIM